VYCDGYYLNHAVWRIYWIMNQFKTFVCSSVSLIVCSLYFPFHGAITSQLTWPYHYSLQTCLFFIRQRLCKRKKCLRCKGHCGACHNVLCSTLPHCLHAFKDLGILVSSNLTMPNQMSFYWMSGFLSLLVGIL